MSNQPEADRRRGPISVAPASFFVLTVLAAAVPVYAHDAETQPNILVYSHSSFESVDPAVLSVFNRSVSAELRGGGLNAVIIEEETLIRDLLDTAGWLGAFFLVGTDHAVADGRFLLEITAYSTWDGKVIARETAAGEIGGEGALPWHELLDVIILVIDAYLKIIEEEDLSTQSELAELSRRDIVVAPEEEPLAEELPIEKEAPYRPISVSAAAAPFFAVGEASDFFKTGAEFAIGGAYGLIVGPGVLELGAAAAVTHFHAEGILASAENWLLSIGPDVRFSLSLPDRFFAEAAMAAGLTLAFVRVDYESRRTIAAPFLSCGISVGWTFTDRISASIAIRYAVHFLPSSAIGGFLPTATASYRF